MRGEIDELKKMNTQLFEVITTSKASAAAPKISSIGSAKKKTLIQNSKA